MRRKACPVRDSGFRFRYCIKFDGMPRYIGSKEYATRRECIDECLNLVRYIKETKPELSKAYRGWKYHGWRGGEKEPKWLDV